MKLSTSIENLNNHLFPETETRLMQTDPEFMQFFQHFAFDEVANQDDLDDSNKCMAILATLIGCQGIEAFREILPKVLELGLTPIEVKEVVYQATAYLGFGRVLPFLNIVNDILTKKGISLPLEGQSNTTPEDRLQKGVQMQVDIFGEQMKEFYQSGPKESRHINLWLADNCFGDYYTRGGLDMRQREMITFCFLSAQGGCEPQLTSHALANMKIGNDRDFLIKVLSQCIPYIGYPRSLNALNCIKEAYSLLKKAEANK
ncbi:carboxymuconolactone decarboxylase family protein [Anaeromicropila herbilytica]|uniref:Carboxymuconolactone decarboxylase n=1 Tax=Anaeromicropila herbilytica TaxID=2785025 RepID=A0A7R7IEH4_9FIRM|nr:carboxymuconolactone decarboxylase family protein [Anaeromicropila herbilytica]BCN31103.1 carboxymuconolactone decarboxylase [Anaeromicropila herbilytica]